jgi:hypothetical protein
MKMTALLALLLTVSSAPAFADSEASFTLPSGVTVKIAEAIFDKSIFKLSGCTDTSPGCVINGHVPMGVAGSSPKTYVKKILISYQNRSYSLDVSDMYDAWGQRPLEREGVVRYFGGKCFDSKNCQFRGLLSDGAASFVAEWRVVDGLPVRTVLSSSDDIVHLFTKHIDPPEFN